MNQEEIKVCVMRVGGTNCDAETQRAFQELGVSQDRGQGIIQLMCHAGDQLTNG